MFTEYKLLELGKSIKEARTVNKLSQKQVKELTGINENTLRNIEKGNVIPKFETLEILSSIYKTDLIDLLKYNRSHKAITDLYLKIDKIVVTGSVKDINILEVELKELMVNNEKSLITPCEFTQLTSFIKVIKVYLEKNTHSYSVALNELYEAIKLSVNDFNIDNFMELHYNPFEIRLLLLIGLIFIEIGKIEQSNSIFIFFLNYIGQLKNYKEEHLKLKVKLLYNISYNFHRLDLYDKALYYSELGIEYLKEMDSFYRLPFFFARKSIAELKLNIDTYKSSMKKCIYLFHIIDDYENVKLFRNIAKTQYGIDIDLPDL